MKMTTTNKINELLSSGLYDKRVLSEELDISRPTLDSRLSGKSNWKKLEINWVKWEYNEYTRDIGKT